MADSAWSNPFSSPSPSMWAAIGGTLGLGLMASLFGSRPRTAYMHAETVRQAETALEAVSLQADQAHLLVSELRADEHSDVKQLLAAKAHRVALDRVDLCRERLEEAREARDLWMASVEVMREVVQDLRAAETAAEAVAIRAMERTLLAGFGPFRPVEKALRALQSALDRPAQDKADDALGEALDAAHAWLSNPVNVDPSVAPPPPEAEFEDVEEGEVQAEVETEPAGGEGDSEPLSEEA